MDRVPGAVFNHFVRKLRGYELSHPWHLPFAVLEGAGVEDIAGAEATAAASSSAFLSAATADDFTWTAFQWLAELGVDLTPVLLPKRHAVAVATNYKPSVSKGTSVRATAATLKNYCTAVHTCLLDNDQWPHGAPLATFVSIALGPCLKSIQGGTAYVRRDSTSYLEVQVLGAVHLTSTQLPEPDYFVENSGSWVDYILFVTVLSAFLLGIAAGLCKGGLRFKAAFPFLTCSSQGAYEHLDTERAYELLNYRINEPQRMSAHFKLAQSPSRSIRVRGRDRDSGAGGGGGGGGGEGRGTAGSRSGSGSGSSGQRLAGGELGSVLGGGTGDQPASPIDEHEEAWVEEDTQAYMGRVSSLEEDPRRVGTAMPRSGSRDALVGPPPAPISVQAENVKWR